MGSRCWSRSWWASFAGFFALGTLWSLAVPLFGAPDEPSHTVRAASVVRGQLRGPERTPPGRPTVTDVVVPELFASAHRVPKCFLRRPAVSPACAPPLVESDRPVVTSTYMGRYPPGYHLLVGLPSRWAVSPLGVHLMRLVSAAAAAALLASALATARSDRSGALLAGLTLAVTPMLLFLAGSVNPNGLEVAAAVGLWVSLLALARGAPAPGAPAAIGTTAAIGPSVRTLAWRAAVAAAVLANSRPLSLVWLVLIVGVVAVATERRRLLSLVRSPAVRAPALATAACTAVAAGWNVARRSYEGYGDPRGPDLSAMEFGLESLGRTGDRALQMVGVFGWTDTRSPLFTYAVWLVGVGLLVAVSLAMGHGRVRLALALLTGLVVAAPVAAEMSQHIGFFWLGRYTLPLAVGIPLLAADAIRPLLSAHRTRVGQLLGLVAMGQVLAFVWALRRFTVVSGDERWVPPVHPAILVAVLTGVVALSWWRLAEGRHRASRLPQISS